MYWPPYLPGWLSCIYICGMEVQILKVMAHCSYQNTQRVFWFITIVVVSCSYRLSVTVHMTFSWTPWKSHFCFNWPLLEFPHALSPMSSSPPCLDFSWNSPLSFNRFFQKTKKYIINDIFNVLIRNIERFDQNLYHIVFFNIFFKK